MVANVYVANVCSWLTLISSNVYSTFNLIHVSCVSLTAHVYVSCVCRSTCSNCFYWEWRFYYTQPAKGHCDTTNLTEKKLVAAFILASGWNQVWWRSTVIWLSFRTNTTIAYLTILSGNTGANFFHYFFVTKQSFW